VILGLLRRLLEAILLVFLVASASFILIHLAPGSPADIILGTNATPEGIAKINHALGLDQPLFFQYVTYITSLARFDLGSSVINNLPVGAIVWSRLPVTMSLAVMATILSSAVGILAGAVAATRGGILDKVLTTLSGVGLALPTFWVGAALVLVFGLTLRLLPGAGYTQPGDSLAGWLGHMILPVTALSLGQVAGIARQTRGAMLTEAERPYVRALLAAGVGRRSIVWKHMLRNAAIPVVTTLGLQFVGVLGGAVVIEYLFALPGIGSALLSAATSHDIPILQGLVVLSAVIVLVVNLLVDLLVVFLSPKARRA
jgi:peptide/nickel transport system permease protein